MKRWHVSVRYLDTHQTEHTWESNVEADTADAAKIAGERKLHGERDDIAVAMDAYAEPLNQVPPGLQSLYG